MAVIEELIRVEENGTISFGNYLIETKKKLSDFEVNGDVYKVKTFKEITKLEKNGRLLVESVPGATFHNFTMNEKSITFIAEASEDIQVTMELEPSSEYKVIINDVNVGKVSANLGGKFSFGADTLNKPANVKIEKCK